MAMHQIPSVKHSNYIKDNHNAPLAFSKRSISSNLIFLLLIPTGKIFTLTLRNKFPIKLVGYLVSFLVLVCILFVLLTIPVSWPEGTTIK